MFMFILTVFRQSFEYIIMHRLTWCSRKIRGHARCTSLNRYDPQRGPGPSPGHNGIYVALRDGKRVWCFVKAGKSWLLPTSLLNLPVATLSVSM